MAYDRFMIAPFQTGLETDLKPWQILDDALVKLDNAYVFRGRLRKRFGSEFTGSGWTTPVTKQLFSRLRIALSGGAGHGVTDAGGDATSGGGGIVVPGGPFKIGQIFSIGAEIFTIRALGNPTTMTTTGSSTTCTFDTTTGAFVFVGATPLTQIYFYPCEPVMGLYRFGEGLINNHPAMAFDTKWAYKYAGGMWTKVGPSITVGGVTTQYPWHGDNADFFWIENWKGIADDSTTMIISNFQVTNPNGGITANDDPMWAYDGVTWSQFQPKFILGVGNNVVTAKIITSWKGRLLLFNTIETNAAGTSNISHQNRVRFSHLGSPFPAQPTALTGGAGVGITSGIGAAAGTAPGGIWEVGQVFTIGNEVFEVVNTNGGPQAMSTTGDPAATHTYDLTNGAYNFTGAPINTQIYFYPTGSGAWLESNQPGADGAGWADASTEEAIISIAFIKDRLVVYFERSTWELADTGNEQIPFIWIKLNTELGSEATFSSVPFDKVILNVGSNGIHACNGSNVERIDTLIPDEVFKIRNRDEGVIRVAGIRDYYTEMVYWTFPSSNQTTTQVYPDRVLVYNYKNNAWAFNDDTFTCFGYFEQQDGPTWASIGGNWQSNQSTWDSGVIQQNFRQIIAGNQHGYVVKIMPELSVNAACLQVTNLTSVGGVVTVTAYDHNLKPGDWIKLVDATGIVFHLLDYGIYQVETTTANTLTFHSTLTGTYLGGGTLQRVSRIDIYTKDMNPYAKQGKSVYVAKIDFALEKTPDGAITVDYFPSSSGSSILDAATVTGTLLGEKYLKTSAYPSVPYESKKKLLWHPVYLQTDGETIQLRLYFSDELMAFPQVTECDFQLEAMVLYTTPISRLQ